MNLSNPKVAVFFLALLPQFASPERGSMPFQLVMLGGVFIAATLLVFGTIALITGRIGKLLLRSARAQNILNGIAGVVFAALAARLATSRL